MKKKITGILLLAVFIIFSMTTFSADKTDKLVLAIGYIPHVQFTPLYVGIEKGFFKDEGIDLQIQYGFGIDVFSLLQTNKIDLALSDSDQLIIAGAKDLGLKAVFQFYQKYPVTIVTKKGKVDSINEFEGKRIGTPDFFGTSYIGMLLFLNYYNLQNKVKIEKIGYTQIASLVADKIDAAVCFYNNEPVQLETQGITLNYWNVKDFSDIVGASFITSNALLTKKKPLIDRFIKAARKSMEYTVNNMDDAYLIAKKYVDGIPPEQDKVMKRILQKTVDLFYSPKYYGYVDEEKYNYSINILYNLGLIDKLYSPLQIIYK